MRRVAVMAAVALGCAAVCVSAGNAELRLEQIQSVQIKDKVVATPLSLSPRGGAQWKAPHLAPAAGADRPGKPGKTSGVVPFGGPQTSGKPLRAAPLPSVPMEPEPAR